LEDRTVLSVFTATSFTGGNNYPPSIITLRDAVAASNADTGKATDTIRLSVGTYTLNLGELDITNSRHALIVRAKA
jgi:hypothetical protein